MKDYQRKLFAIFLIFLVLNQDLCSAKKFAKPDKLKITTEEEEDVGAVTHHRGGRSRRSVIGSVLIGVSLFASVAQIGLTVYLMIEGCCGPFPDACTYQTLFDNTIDNIEATSALIDDKWLLSTNLLTYIGTASLKNEEIALEMQRITEVYPTIIETIDTDTLNKYDNFSTAIQKSIEENNATVLAYSYAEIDLEYQSLFSNELGRLQILSGLIGGIAEGVLVWTWNYYKSAQIQKMLETTYGQQLAYANSQNVVNIMGVGDDIDNFVYETAVIRESANEATILGENVIRDSEIALATLETGIEQYSVILRLIQCSIINDQIKSAYDTIKPVDTSLATLYTEITGNYDNMSASWDSLKDQLRSEDFIGYLYQIKNMSDSAETQTTLTQRTSTGIQTFIDNIDGTEDMLTIIGYQDTLISALENSTYILSCLSNKVKVYAKVAERCQTGDNVLLTLFDTAVVDFNPNDNACTSLDGIADTEYSSVESYVTTLAADLSFNVDCPLNDQTSLSSVCSSKCDGWTSAETASQLSISEDYVIKFEDLCEECPITPEQATYICNAKDAGLSLDQIILVYSVSFTESQITTAYNAC